MTSVSHSAPHDLSLYLEQRGGFVDLVDGSYIQGSLQNGGIQPDYKIDFQDPNLKKFLQDIKSAVAESYQIKTLELLQLKTAVFQKKIELVVALIQQAMPENSYTGKPYLSILAEHRLKQKDISIGEYLQCQAGVCREHALLTHLALKAVGVSSRYVYVTAQQGFRIEDHAVVVVESKGEKWIVDAYNPNFHGRNFKEMLLDPETLNHAPRVAKYTQDTGKYGRILKVNSYPIYWNPKAGSTHRCAKVYL